MNLTRSRLAKLKLLIKGSGATLAFLFGSFASGETNSESDIDIAILFPPSLSARKRADARLKLLTKLSRTLPREIDLVVLNDIRSLFLKYVIVSEGLVIFEADRSESADYINNALREYFDFAPFLKEYHRRSLERGYV